MKKTFTIALVLGFAALASARAQDATEVAPDRRRRYGSHLHGDPSRQEDPGRARQAPGRLRGRADQEADRARQARGELEAIKQKFEARTRSSAPRRRSPLGWRSSTSSASVRSSSRIDRPSSTGSSSRCRSARRVWKEVQEKIRPAIDAVVKERGSICCSIRRSPSPAVPSTTSPLRHRQVGCGREERPRGSRCVGGKPAGPFARRRAKPAAKP